MASKKGVKKTAPVQKVDNKQDDSKTFAFIATFLSIIGFVIAIVAKKDNKYVMHHAKQSLALFIVYLAIYIVFWIFASIFTIFTFGMGAVIMAPIGMILGLLFFIFWIISWVNALSGEEKILPIVGKFGEKFNF